MTNTHRSIAFLAALAALTLAASPAAAQAKHETQAQLKKEAKVSMVVAKKTALAAVPKGWVKSSELEREHGKLLYSFDIASKGKSGIDEVQIDAITGAQIGGVVHESPTTEKKEAKTEAKAAKADMKAMKKP
jgi:uncharacterized membrane protein YkoI